jgi:hypothetical protein
MALYRRPSFFTLAKSRLSLDVPEALTNPQIVPRLDDPDPAVMAAIAAVRVIRTAAVRSDPLDWYFQLGDKATERVVVRHIFGVAEGADIGKESDAIAGRIFDMSEKLAEFAGYFIWENTKR